MAGQIVRIWKGYGTQAGVDRYCDEHFPNSVLPHLPATEDFPDIAKKFTPPDAI
jgi:hypothetical protein